MIGNNSNCHIQPAHSCNDFSLLLLFGLTIATDNNVSRYPSPSLNIWGNESQCSAAAVGWAASPSPRALWGQGVSRGCLSGGGPAPCRGPGVEERERPGLPQPSPNTTSRPPPSDGAGAAAAAVTSLLINLRVDDASLASESSRVYLF